MAAAAGAPFVFKGCVGLREALGEQASDARELMDRLERVPAESVFFHTFGYFLRHRPFTTAYGNDFARWVTVELGEHALGERLAVVDPFAFDGLEALRAELVSILHAHVRERGVPPRVERGHAFHFQRSHLVEVPLGLEASTLAELRAGIAAADASAIYLHLVEARARLARPTSDFGEWLRASLGMPALADRIDRIDAYLTTLERVRGRLLALVDEALEGARA
jgi:hypothetical protein